MQKVVFPYFVGMSRGDSSDGEFELELTDEEYERLKRSFNSGKYGRIDDDPEINEIWSKVYEAIKDIERDNLEAFPEIVEDYFSWEDDFDGEVTDDLIEEYLDEMRCGINYPDELDSK